MWCKTIGESCVQEVSDERTRLTATNAFTDQVGSTYDALLKIYHCLALSLRIASKVIVRKSNTVADR